MSSNISIHNSLKFNLSMKGWYLVWIMIGLLTCGNTASAAFVTTWQATNKTGDKVSDFEGIFVGTGGSIANAMIVMNDPNAGAATITGSSNMIKIDWAAVQYFPDNATVEFKFMTDFPQIFFNSGKWTRTALGLPDIDIKVGPGGNTVINQVSEPSILSLLGVGIAGLLIWCRNPRSRGLQEKQSEH